MASYPPPYPPPGQPPYGFDPKAQARVAREQAKLQRQAYKAQRDAYKAQRYMYRQQMLGLRRRSLLGPLLLVSVGVVLLLARSWNVTPLTALEIYSRWWPMLFVFAGVVVLVEWAVDHVVHSQHPEEPVLGRRSFGGGAVFLLIVLTAAGVLGMGIRDHAHTWLSSFGDSEGLAMFLGDKHEADQTIDPALAFGPQLNGLEIDDSHGDVSVTGGSPDGKVHLSVHKEIYSQTDSGAAQGEQQLTPAISTSGSWMTVRVPVVEGGTADLVITVPDKTAVTVTSNHGDVTVKDIKASVNVTANHGDVDLGTISGDVSARVNRSDASFSAHNIDGAVALRGSAQDLTVEDIGGQVSLEGDFYGTTHLEKVRGGVRFHTSRTDFQLARLDGEAEISSDASLTVDHGAGPTMLTTRNRNITMDRMSGDVSVTNSNGTVEITGAAPLGSVTVQNRKGEVDVTLPDHSSFSVEADTTDGGIDNEFGMPDVAHNPKATMSGVVGHGGPRVKVTTTHGDISFRKAEIAPAAPSAPAAPAAPPAAPAKPAGPSGRAPKAPAAPAAPVHEVVF